LALTATASPPVRDEIVSRLRLHDPVQIVHGFDRPNLRLSVDSFRAEDRKREAAVLRAMGEQKPGIIYTATRKSAETLAAELQDYGLNAAAYHAGLRAADRESVQDLFLEGRLEVVVATTAFGMGVDKADVRFVLHAEVADSLDSYYQEIGRAGRDGGPAEAVLFYRPEDLGLRTFFASSAPNPDALQRVGVLLGHAVDPVDPAELADLMGISTSRLAGLVNLLEQVGTVHVDETGRLSAVQGLGTAREAAASAVELAEARRRVEKSRIEMMRGYAETQGCRRQYLLAYFGEAYGEQCGNCDTCESGTASAQPDAASSPYALQSRVTHASWGSGLVMRYEGDRIVVLFEDVGYRTLSLEKVQSSRLLVPA
ncbi:MAG: RecQ family zinc-binding domain-containing protein, partial [Actinobacteria bacterium]|nr:RecQ family zinc-binding domain-containing protein [Actinomycetota bacterium]